MLFIRYKKLPPVNLEKVFSIKTCPFTNTPKGDIWVISFFSDASDGKACLQWQFHNEQEKNNVYKKVMEAFGEDELISLDDTQND